MNSNWTARLNPELLRSLRVTLPPKRVLFIAGLTLALMMVVGGVSWNEATTRTYLSPEAQIHKFGNDMYWLLGVVLFALLFILTPATAALSFIQEKVRGTSIFQQMVLSSPFEMAAGKFVGSGLIGYLLTALIFPFFMMAAVIGGVDFFGFVRLSLFLLLGGLCCQSVGLFISAALSGPSDRFLRGGLLIGPAVGGLGALVALALYQYFDGYHRSSSDYAPWYFYGINVGAQLVILGLLAFVGVWAFAGTVRRIKASQLIPLRSWPVWLFFASSEAVLTGLLWGGIDRGPYNRFFLFPPNVRLVIYLLLNWAALMVLAGSSALGRERLREWWSASSDPLSLFQRREIKKALVTFMLALGISLFGLTALWASFHMDGFFYPQNIPSGLQLAAITACFTFAVAGAAAFIQYSAMQRFRIGAWAGVVLTLIFYLVMGVIGASLENKRNTAALVNPLVYTVTITEGDPFIDRHETFGARDPDTDAAWKALAHGLLANGALALCCFGLAYAKWLKTEGEILDERT
ncbi:MAG TPA: hypothetical protein VM911_05310 [Pyrinomonadaceae bacterium]|jgi:hypothetical protein|nr:hypothetical protein [Pyrinomonadaceae bacterium]